MIGDIIYNHRDWMCPVVGIDEDHVTVIARHYGVVVYKWEDVRPVPMTEDIILQLGWEEIPEDSPKHQNRIGLGKQYKHPWYTDTLNIHQNSLTELHWCNEMPITFLHNLQHILDLTIKDKVVLDGIDKLKIDMHHVGEGIDARPYKDEE